MLVGAGGGDPTSDTETRCCHVMTGGGKREDYTWEVLLKTKKMYYGTMHVLKK